MKAYLDCDEVLAKHSYAIADKQVQTINEYCKLYIKEKPIWLPKFVYKALLSRVLVLARFKKPNQDT